MFFRKLNWNVVGWFQTVSIISYVLIFAGIAMMGYNYFTKGYFIRLGLSFTGGTDVTVKYQRPTTQADIQKALAGVGVSDAFVNTLGRTGDAQPNERFTISTQKAFGNDTAPLWTALNSVAPVDRAQSQIESVFPSLSREYLQKALLALVIAISIQFLYIAFRFGWNYIFGTVVVIALVRDSFMMIGIYALSGRRADDAFLAAVLTVIGYSVMDTIVILDRIRENLRVMPGEAFDRLVNTSIMQTMARSVGTLATVVIVLLALLLFGGGSLQNFAFRFSRRHQRLGRLPLDLLLGAARRLLALTGSQASSATPHARFPRGRCPAATPREPWRRHERKPHRRVRATTSLQRARSAGRRARSRRLRVPEADRRGTRSVRAMRSRGSWTSSPKTSLRWRKKRSSIRWMRSGPAIMTPRTSWGTKRSTWILVTSTLPMVAPLSAKRPSLRKKRRRRSPRVRCAVG